MSGQRATKLPFGAPLRAATHGGAPPSIVNQSITRSTSWAASSRPMSFVLVLPNTL